MSVTVTKTSRYTAEITWTADDDPKGHIARTVESDQLAYALKALGAGEANHQDPVMPEGENQAEVAAMHTVGLARLLERRAAVQVVKLRDVQGLSWRRIATVLFEDPDRQSSVRRMYESGRRHLGI